MAELSLRARLQPALLDRLADDERFLTLFQIEAAPEDFSKLRLSEREWLGILSAQGLRRMGGEESESDVPAAAARVEGSAPAPDERLRWHLFAPAGRVSLAQLKALVLKPSGAPGGIAVQDFCRIETRNVPNGLLEAADRRVVSMRRLREYVLRDLTALLNAFNLETNVDLARYPRVQRSVLNYGMRPLAGLGAAAVDPVRIAANIEEAIRRFEPRLRRVRVSPEMREGAEGHQLSFRIDAELWGQPSPQQLVLRTRIETDTCNVTVGDNGGG